MHVNNCVLAIELMLMVPELQHYIIMQAKQKLEQERVFSNLSNTESSDLVYSFGT